MVISILGSIYRNIIKKILFLFDPEFIHNLISAQGELIGKFKFLTQVLSTLFAKKYPLLKQNIAGITFEGPVGLAAGFDYDARLTQTLYAIGFGYQTIGTISNHAYGGNPRPMLGRLPKSKSLMVNKGFKNKGASAIAKKLSNLSFKIPVGVSIGVTNSKKIKSQKNAIEDVLSAFDIFELSNIKIAYYELNISCPNLSVAVSFYSPKNLDELLKGVDNLKLAKPIFIKMPIDKTDKQILQMLEVIIRHKVAGVIFGNLQKDRNDPALDKDEVKQFKVGNFSGKPTERRSNELIALTHRYYKNKLIIIGCGGIFNANDAYKKIKLGANLVQLITGLIFEGPTLVAQINKELSDKLKNDGYKNIKEAIGVENL